MGHATGGINSHIQTSEVLKKKHSCGYIFFKTV